MVVKPANSGVSGSSDGPISLNLVQVFDIVVDVASGLEYVHYHRGASVVHSNLKTSNTLFYDEMVAHVGDLGVAKFPPYGNGIINP